MLPLLYPGVIRPAFNHAFSLRMYLTHQLERKVSYIVRLHTADINRKNKNPVLKLLWGHNEEMLQGHS